MITLIIWIYNQWKQLFQVPYRHGLSDSYLYFLDTWFGIGFGILTELSLETILIFVL